MSFPTTRSTRARLVAALVALGVLAVVACTPSSQDAVDPGTGVGRERAPQGTFVTAGERLGLGGCPVFPRDNAFHATIDRLPVAAGSASTIAAAGGASQHLMAGFSEGIWMGSRLGWPTNVVDGRTVAWNRMLVSNTYAWMSDMTGVPWPTLPRFEGWPGKAWDKHLQVLDTSTCTNWELINVQLPSENYYGSQLNMWYADAIVSMDLTSNDAQPAVTAAGFSGLAGLIRYDEVAAGNIDHAISLVFPTIRSGAPTWPAMGSDGRSTDPSAPPMGTWLRLRDDVDVDRFPPQSRVIVRAMRDHGVIIMDSGPNAALAGEPDTRWSDADLNSLRGLTVADFDVVDPSAMKVSDRSFQIR